MLFQKTPKIKQLGLNFPNLDKTLCNRARKKLRNDTLSQIDLKKKRFILLSDAQSFVHGKEDAKYVYTNVNCNIHSENNKKIFSLIDEVEYVSRVSFFPF